MQMLACTDIDRQIKLIIKYLLCFFLVLFNVICYANQQRVVQGMSEADKSIALCFEQAGAFHKINPIVLSAIAEHESGLSSHALTHNKNGSYDIGLMQINSKWLSNLSKFGIQQKHLMDPCINIFVGAWILSQQMKRFGNTWTAVGAYHSRTVDRNLRYAWAIYNRVHKKIKVH